MAQVSKAILKVRENVAKAKADIKNAYEVAEKVLHEREKGHPFHFYPAFIQAKQNYIKQQEDHLKNFQQELQKKTQKFTELRGQVKVLEKWKEKDFQNF